MSTTNQSSPLSPDHFMIPVTKAALPCIFPITGFSHPTIWIRVTPDPLGIALTLFKEMHLAQQLTDNPDDILGTAYIDYFEGKLSVLAFNQENLDDEPMQMVLVENMRALFPPPQEGEGEGE